MQSITNNLVKWKFVCTQINNQTVLFQTIQFNISFSTILPSLGIVQKTEICPGEWDAQYPLRFWDTNESPNLSQTTKPLWWLTVKERTCWIVNFAVQVAHKLKTEENGGTST